MSDNPALDAITARIHRACLTVTCLPADGPKAFFSTWPRFKLDWYDIEEFGDQRTDKAITARLIHPPRFVPTAKEIDDCLPALELLDGCAPAARRVIRLRALQDWYSSHGDTHEDHEWLNGGWRRIGELCGISHTWAKALHLNTMKRAFMIASAAGQNRQAKSTLKTAF